MGFLQAQRSCLRFMNRHVFVHVGCLYNKSTTYVVWCMTFEHMSCVLRPESQTDLPYVRMKRTQVLFIRTPKPFVDTILRTISRYREAGPVVSPNGMGHRRAEGEVHQKKSRSAYVAPPSLQQSRVCEGWVPS